VLVAADGALPYVPFTVLPVTHDERPFRSWRYGGCQRTLNVLAAQRARQRPQQPSRTLAVFADPVFREPTSG
jgi:hypothetical protein